MTFNAPTNAGKYVTSNIACERSQRYTKQPRLLIGLKMCVKLHNFLTFVGPNVISDGLTLETSIS